ncbi:MAG: amino acid ABC transporter substrate-binding protein [Actinobacteria bacterium]|nr:amino acid ABC transporter substrate-binding protein [Actinomycetota bacterium]
MRRALFGLALTTLVLAFAATATGGPNEPAAIPGCAKSSLNLIEDGKLTLGTDNPAFPPWWGGSPKKPWKTSYPYSGKGYESAVAYTIAKRLGFAHGDVQWTAMPYTKAYAPGKKPFDFYLAQISYSPVRAKAVSFSSAYYFVNQAIVALKGKPIAKVKSVAGLKPYKFGAPLGSTSYSYIVRYIKPSEKPAVYDTLNDGVTALKNGQIDGLVVDFPSTGYITGVQVPNSVVVGRLPTQGTKERFGLVFEKGNPLVSCVNKALAAMRRDGTLKRLERQWLAGSAPLLK